MTSYTTKFRCFILTCALLLASLACHLGLETVATLTPGPAPTAARQVSIVGAAVEYYDIQGSSATDLRAEMDRLGPLDADGRHYDARTDWYIHWNWPGSGTDHCNLSQATTSIEITVTMPRWANPQGADPALIILWNDYLSALARHEQVHVSNANAGLANIKKAIQTATCATAAQAAQDAYAAIAPIDRDYDTQTRHGATQGAKFP